MDPLVLTSHALIQFWTLMRNSWIESRRARCCMSRKRWRGRDGDVITPFANELQCNETVTLKATGQLRIPAIAASLDGPITSCETNRDLLCHSLAGNRTNWPGKETCLPPIPTSPISPPTTGWGWWFGSGLGWLRFGEFPRLVGRYCSYLLPKQHGGTFQI